MMTDQVEEPKFEPKSELLLPRRSLAACIYGALVRDTRGCDLSERDRLNHFAASPLCALSWCFEGSSSLLESMGGGVLNHRPIGSIVFSGPQSVPRTSLNNSEIYSMTIALYPDAFKALTGIEVANFVDQNLSVEEVFSGELLELFSQVLRSGDAKTGFDILQNYIDPKWQAGRAGNLAAVNSISDWAMSIIEKAPKSGLGKSLRQVERRIKAWTGHTKRDLEYYARIERSFDLASAAMKTGAVEAADIAVKSGFSDQSHMGRNVKRQTGHSPKDLLWRIENEEAYWSYRLIAGLEKTRQ